MNYLGEGGGNERSSSSSSSRKGKKSNLEKPKQPQRGLGVAQLEKIRLNSQFPFLHNPQDMMIESRVYSSSSYSYTSPSTASSYNTLQGHQNLMMGPGELERSNVLYGESQHINNRWNAGSPMLEAQNYAQPGITRHLFNLEVEESSRKKKMKDQGDSMGSSSQNSDSNGSQELDLELRLSL